MSTPTDRLYPPPPTAEEETTLPTVEQAFALPPAQHAAPVASQQVPVQQASVAPQQASAPVASQQPHDQQASNEESGKSDEEEEEEEEEEEGDPSDEELLSVLRVLADSDPDIPGEFQARLENSLSKPVQFKRLQVLVHPDRAKFGVEHKDETARASTNLNAWRLALGGNRDNFWIGRSIAPYQDGVLSERHKEAHQKATPYVKICFDAMVKDPRLVPGKKGEKMDEQTSNAVTEIAILNLMMRRDNRKENLNDRVGKIRLVTLAGYWRALLLSGPDPETRGKIISNNAQICAHFGWPEQWANPGSIVLQPEPNLVPHAGASSDPSIDPQPGVWNSQPPPLSQQLWNVTGNQIRTVSIPPRTVARCVKPGFTSSGEQILAVQELSRDGARFVVANARGETRFVSCSNAGGQPALNAARKAGVVSFTKNPEEIRVLRDRVRGGGFYGLTFVAVGEWNASSDRLPFIGVGFWHVDAERNIARTDVAISRSALKDILAASEAERLMAECMTTQPGLSSVKEALQFMGFMPPTPMRLPYKKKPLLLPPNQLEDEIQNLQAQLQQLQLQKYPQQLGYQQPQAQQVGYPQQPGYQQPQVQQPGYQHEFWSQQQSQQLQQQLQQQPQAQQSGFQRQPEYQQPQQQLQVYQPGFQQQPEFQQQPGLQQLQQQLQAHQSGFQQQLGYQQQPQQSQQQSQQQPQAQQSGFQRQPEYQQPQQQLQVYQPGFQQQPEFQQSQQQLQVYQPGFQQQPGSQQQPFAQLPQIPLLGHQAQPYNEPPPPQPQRPDSSMDIS